MTRARFSFNTPTAKFALVLLVIIILSLLPHYHEIYAGAEVSPALVVHGALYLIWYVLFAVQAGLVAAGNMRLHRMLGLTSLGLMGLLVWSGLDMLIGVMASYQPDWDPAFHVSRASFVWAITHTLICFCLFYGVGIGYRTRPAVHRRFMMLAALSMISASVTRFAYLPFMPIDGTALTLLMTYGLLIAALVVDRVQHGQVHAVLKWGVPSYAVTQILALGALPSTDLGLALAFPF
ncbi:MAG: hypothetical protein ACPG1C_03925 [Alphaproteobacteria bacterium]